MRISIQTYGTRGDVQPYIALALELIRRRHVVQLAGPLRYASLARLHGVVYSPMPDGLLALLEAPTGKAVITKRGGFFAGLELLPSIRPLVGELLTAEWEAVKAFKPDLILYYPKSIATPHMAEALKCSCILAALLPAFTPTSEFPSPLMPFADLGPLNRFSHRLALAGADRIFRKQIGNWRALELGLQAGAGLKPLGTLYACSAHIVPKPTDWPPAAAMTGYWFLNEPDWRPDPELSRFLAAGDTPIFVGFGSMPGLDPQELTQAVTSALAASGKRGLLAIAGGALCASVTGSHVHVIDQGPHDQLFPVVSGIIHHGGAGTTGAALRAGRPMIIHPYFGDQPYWGRLMAELGIAPEPLTNKTLTVESLTRAIAFIDKRSVRRRADDLGRAIRAEAGPELAVDLIEKWTTSPA